MTKPSTSLNLPTENQKNQKESSPDDSSGAEDDPKSPVPSEHSDDLNISNKPANEELSDSSDDLPLVHYKEHSIKEKRGIQSEGEWVIVEYLGRKDTPMHFIGQIKKNVSDTTFQIDFLKKSNKTDNFILPTKKDSDEISSDMIIKRINDPHVDGSGKRHFYIFDIPDRENYLFY